MTTPVSVAAELTSIVQSAWMTREAVRVVERDPRLDRPLEEAAARMRLGDAQARIEPVTAAVREMYRRVGVDPTKTRPSSEALLRRVRKGEGLPRINSLVDVINWCSLETQLPFGLYDLDGIQGAVTLRLGRPGEEYEGIRKAVVHLTDRMTLADEAGPFGNPTSDSARTMVTGATRRALVVIFAPARLPRSVVEAALTLTGARV